MYNEYLYLYSRYMFLKTKLQNLYTQKKTEDEKRDTPPSEKAVDMVDILKMKTRRYAHNIITL